MGEAAAYKLIVIIMEIPITMLYVHPIPQGTASFLLGTAFAADYFLFLFLSISCLVKKIYFHVLYRV